MANFSTNWILYTNPRTKKTNRNKEESITLNKEKNSTNTKSIPLMKKISL